MTGGKRKPRSDYATLWAIMKDPRPSAAAKCAATVCILKFRNNETGKCNPSFTTIGREMGRGRTAAIDAINQLKALGWLTVESTKGGAKSNTSNFVFKGPSGAESRTGTSAESTTGLEDTTGAEDNRDQSGSPDRTGPGVRSRTILEPSLNLRAREPSSAEALGSLGSLVSSRIGLANAVSWFSDAPIVDISSTSITIELSTLFRRNRVAADFETDVLNCCRRLRPSIKTVKFVVRG